MAGALAGVGARRGAITRAGTAGIATTGEANDSDGFAGTAVSSGSRLIACGRPYAGRAAIAACVA